MNIHIVRVNEKIERIALLYNLTIDEIIKINQHVKDWNHLIPGTKLRLPEIPEIVRTELDNTEPFIEEYYPKIDVQTILDNNQNIENINSSNNFNVLNKKEVINDSKDLEVEKENLDITESKNQTKVKKHYVNPYMQYYNGGYYYPYYYTSSYYRNKKRKKK